MKNRLTVGLISIGFLCLDAVRLRAGRPAAATAKSRDIAAASSSLLPVMLLITLVFVLSEMSW